MQLFPEITLSETEQDIIRERLTNEAVRKYFKLLSNRIAVHILTAETAPGQSAEEHLRLRARFQGQLECLETLYSSYQSTETGA